MQTITIKLPIIDTIPESLKDTARQYSESFNRVCVVGWEQKRINGVDLHHLTYSDERQKTNLPSQLVISARMKATEALKSAKARLKKGKKVSCPSTKNLCIRYDARSATIRLDKQIATLASNVGRIAVSFKLCSYYSKYSSWKTCSSDLCFKKDGKVFLHVVVTSPEPVVPCNDIIIGVDLGVNRPAVTSNGQFFGKKQWKNVINKNFKLRQTLQAKGTDSAKRHLKKLSQKENRFRKDCDHVISRRIIDSAIEGSTVVLEDLTNIRSSMKAKRNQRRRMHSWSFFRLQSFLDYKAKAKGITVEYVDPRYTSQKCSSCGHIEKRNRQTQSLFVCKKCGFQHNADLNAAKNIRLNYLASKGLSAGSELQSTNLS